MFTKRAITLAALLIAGATSAAFAYEDPENKIGDRYPSLEQQYQPVASKAVRAMPAPKAPKLDQYINEDVENKIADRYPLLEQPVQVTTVGTPTLGRVSRLNRNITVAVRPEMALQSARAVF